MAEYLGRRFGNYQLTRMLGEGGFAEVYLGEHIHLGTQAAIKVLHTRLTNDDVEKFREEARTVARLIHPNIVRVLEFGIEARTPFLVMDYAPNGTLRHKHPRGTQVSLQTVVSYVASLADALQCAHDEKLIHRDVKPENMLLGRRHEILLSDFGIALVAQSSRYQNTQDMAGTIAYMAPEQIQGKPRPASDQYALAIVVYEWLSGNRPFHGSFTEIATQHVLTPPQPLGQRIVIGPEVEQVVMTALSKDPGDRFKSVQAFARALAQASQLTISPDVATSEPAKQTGSTLTASPVSTRPSTPPTRDTAPTPMTTVTPQTTSLHCIYMKHTQRVNAVAWSPDGSRIASCSNDQTVHIWNADTAEKRIAYISHTGNVNTIAWSPDGRLIASGSDDQTVRIWDASSGEDVFTLSEHLALIKALAWSPDGRYLAFGTKNALIHIWNFATKSVVATRRCSQNVVDTFLGVRNEVNTLTWSPQGTHLAAGSFEGSVRLWTAQGQFYKRYGYPGNVSAVQWSPDNKYLACSFHSEISIQDNATGKIILSYGGHTRAISGLAWRPHRTHIASASGKTVQIWNVTTGKQISIYRYSAPVTSVAWSPDGKYLASGSDDKTVTVWQVR